MIRRAAFSLIEVLAATALFGLAAAGLFMALSPAHEALLAISEYPDDACSLEIVRAAAESSRTRSELERGGEVPLPTGVMVAWRATLETTRVEALYRVTLTGERDGAPPLRSTYLHFEPRWAEASEGAPQWLEHASAAAAVGGKPAGAAKPDGKGKPGAPGGKGDTASRGDAPGGRAPRGGGAVTGSRPAGGSR